MVPALSTLMWVSSGPTQATPPAHPRGLPIASRLLAAVGTAGVNQGQSCRIVHAFAQVRW